MIVESTIISKTRSLIHLAIDIMRFACLLTNNEVYDFSSRDKINLEKTFGFHKVKNIPLGLPITHKVL